MSRYIFDIETDGFIKNMTRVHCLAMRDEETRETFRFRHRDAGKYLTKLRKGKPGQPNFEAEEYGEFDAENNVEEGIRMLMEAEAIIGHNIIGFDIKAIQKIFPWFQPKGQVIDTLVLSRLLVPDTKPNDYKLHAKNAIPGQLIGSHSLDAWGYRLGLNKGDYSKIITLMGLDPWRSWNLPMDDYCELDIDVTEVLWAAIKKDLPDQRAVDLEQGIHALACHMTSNGFPFDKAEAEKLAAKLEAEHAKLTDAVKAKYGFWYRPQKKYVVRPLWEDPAGINAAKDYGAPRTDFGEDLSRAVWADFVFPKQLRVNGRLLKDRNQVPKPRTAKEKPHDPRRSPDLDPDCPFCPIERREFNPNSRQDIIDRFTTLHNWVPEVFTETGQPQLDDKVLTALADRIPEAKPIAELFFLTKLLGMIKNGKVSWIGSCEEDGKIRHYLNTGGTVSGRCSHNAPNLGQVMSVMVAKHEDGQVITDDGPIDIAPEDYRVIGKKKDKAILFGRHGEYGWECRSLFYTPAIIDGEAWVQLGVDLSGIEFRMLAEQTVRFDNGALIDVILSGDIHAINMAATGVTDRGKIKRILYGLLYGAGDWKLGITYDPNLSQAQARRVGGEIRAKLMVGLPALKKAIDVIKDQAERGFLIGLDGRRLMCRSAHSSLNLRLQSDAALVAKKWVCLTEDYFLDEGWDHAWDGDFAMLAFVHDELQTAIKKKYANRGAELCIKAAKDAGEYFNLRCPISAEAKIGSNWAQTH